MQETGDIRQKTLDRKRERGDRYIYTVVKKLWVRIFLMSQLFFSDMWRYDGAKILDKKRPSGGGARIAMVRTVKSGARPALMFCSGLKYFSEFTMLSKVFI